MISIENHKDLRYYVGRIMRGYGIFAKPDLINCPAAGYRRHHYVQQNLPECDYSVEGRSGSDDRRGGRAGFCCGEQRACHDRISA